MPFRWSRFENTLTLGDVNDTAYRNWGQLNVAGLVRLLKTEFNLANLFSAPGGNFSVQLGEYDNNTAAFCTGIGAAVSANVASYANAAPGPDYTLTNDFGDGVELPDSSAVTLVHIAKNQHVFGFYGSANLFGAMVASMEFDILPPYNDPLVSNHIVWLT